MTMATIFQSGNSQAMRIPKSFRVKSKKVMVNRYSNGTFLVSETFGLSGKHKNVIEEVLAKTGENKKQCPDISEFFKGDDEQFKEIF